MSARPGRRGEAALVALAAAAAVALAGVYAFAFAVVLARGAARALRPSVAALALEDVDGERMARAAVAALLFGGAAAAALWPLGRRGGALARAPLVGGSLAAIVGATVLRDHAPPFLVLLSSEVRAGAGIGPQVFNTLYCAVLSTALTLPVGLGAAVYLARFAQAPRFVAAVRVALDTLASLPSVVYGLFGFLVFVVEMRAGYSLFAGASVLALLNLPLVVAACEASILAVPRDLEDASLALGASRVQTTLRVTLPYAWPGVLSATVLAVGRVFAESAPLIMTAGTTVSRANAYSLDPYRGGETLAVHLWYVNSAGLVPDRVEVSAGTAAVLLVLVGATNVVAARLARLGAARSGRP